MIVNGKRVTLTYPDGNTRAFTMSFDDGTHQDGRVMELCRKYGMGCTFAPNTAFINGSQGGFVHLGQYVTVNRSTPETFADFYRGFEIAGHTHTHPFLVNIPDEDMKKEIFDSNAYLSSLVGYEVKGLTYPCNSYDDRVISFLKKYGVVYARTTEATHGFDPPADFLKWHPTIHDHDPKALELVDECIRSRKAGLKVFYSWGHAYEFDKPDANFSDGQRWEDFEKLLKKVSGSKKFWCVSNIEVYDYLTAVKALVFDGTGITNRSSLDVYAKIDGRKSVVPAGKRLEL